MTPWSGTIIDPNETKYMANKPLPQELIVDGKITENGITVVVNKERFPIRYPKDIWASYPQSAKEALRDALTVSSTMFLPQILSLPEIRYKTSRTLAETFLFKNGIYDMPCTAHSDKRSSIGYIKDFFNVRSKFGSNTIHTVRTDRPISDTPTAVIPFSFGKESMLTLALCKELGIRPIPIIYVEPSHAFEHAHKKKMIAQFEKEFDVKIHIVENSPGIFRYGAYWGFSTELGWGLHTTECALLTLPFAHHFNADLVILGNEQSCNDSFVDREGVLTYSAAYDQHTDWTSQQGLLASLLLGREIGVASLMEPLYELAILKVLHTRYPAYGAFQMSCFANNEQAKQVRWCQNCSKCAYVYALSAAFDIDLERMGFTANLFDKDHARLYADFFKKNGPNLDYGTKEELGLALTLAIERGRVGHTLDLFKKRSFADFSARKKELSELYLGIHPFQNIPSHIAPEIVRIYTQELGPIGTKKRSLSR